MATAFSKLGAYAPCIGRGAIQAAPYLGRSAVCLTLAFPLFLKNPVQHLVVAAADKLNNIVKGVFGEGKFTQSTMAITVIGLSTFIPWGAMTLAARNINCLSGLSMGPKAYVLTVIIPGVILGCVI